MKEQVQDTLKRGTRVHATLARRETMEEQVEGTLVRRGTRVWRDSTQSKSLRKNRSEVKRFLRTPGQTRSLDRNHRDRVLNLAGQRELGRDRVVPPVRQESWGRNQRDRVLPLSGQRRLEEKSRDMVLPPSRQKSLKMSHRDRVVPSSGHRSLERDTREGVGFILGQSKSSSLRLNILDNNSRAINFPPKRQRSLDKNHRNRVVTPNKQTISVRLKSPGPISVEKHSASTLEGLKSSPRLEGQKPISSLGEGKAPSSLYLEKPPSSLYIEKPPSSSLPSRPEEESDCPTGWRYKTHASSQSVKPPTSIDLMNIPPNDGKGL